MNAEEIVDLDDAALGNLISDEPDTPPADPPAEGTPPADPPAEGTPPADTVESLRAELAISAEKEKQAANRITDKESFIQRQANELGELRKLTQVDPDTLRNQFDEDPVAAVNKMQAMKEAENRELELTQSIAAEQNKAAVLQAVPEFSGMVDAIAELATADGVPQSDVALFKVNPYTTPSSMLINLANRVKANQRITKLEAELASQKKRSTEIVGKIEQTAKSTNRLSGASTGVADPSSKVISDAQLTSMTDEELKAYIKAN